MVKDMSDKSATESGARFTQTLVAAAQLPGVRIRRSDYLAAALKPHASASQVGLAVSQSPAAADVSLKTLTKLAADAVKLETGKVTGLSAAAGLPGGLAMLGTVPADLAQYFGHLLRVCQKLAYLYGWPDLFGGNDKLPVATRNLLVLFVGTMFDSQAAQLGLARAASLVAHEAEHQLPTQALVDGELVAFVDQTTAQVGARMAKQLVAGGVAKAIPLLGAALSGGLTYTTFRPMAARLQDLLPQFPLAKPTPTS